jgi:tryptophan halogenase
MKTNKIIIVGGGSAGWMTAATLIKSFPEKEIYVIESKNVPVIGVGESTIGGIRQWAKYIGLKDEDFFKETDASIKMSIKFTDFYKKDFGSFHYPFGRPLHITERNSFTDWHYKKYLWPETETEDFVRCLFPAAALFENNRYSLNEDKSFDNFNPDLDIAYHFDAVKFGRWLKNNVCLPQGVEHIESTVLDVIVGDNGIEKLILENGTEVFADLYVDCTGFKSLLLGEALKVPFDSYSNMLPNNKAWATRLEYKNKEKELEGFTNCTAIENGWCWNIPLWSRLGTGYVYSDKFISSEEAKEQFKNYLMSDKMIVPRTREEVDSLEYKDITMRVGIHERTFVKNVVAIGLSAGFIEPLESNGLFSVHEFLFRLSDILQRGDISQFDRDMYNVQVRRLFDDFTKFVSLHYALSHRDDTEYWREIKNKEFTDSYKDPYSPHLGKSDAYWNMAWRYLDNWTHPINSGGLPYISTGLQMFMTNDYRFMVNLDSSGINYIKEITDISNIWEGRKARWLQEAYKSPTLLEFLKEKYYFTE